MNILKALRILDENGTLSLTNIALIASVVKTCVAPQVGLAEIGFNLLALASYQYKRWHNSKQTNQEIFTDRIVALEKVASESIAEPRIAAIENNLSLLKSAFNMRK